MEAPLESQIPLFDESQLPAGRELLLPAEVQRHQFTGERVARNEQRYAAIVQALGEGLGVRQIARAFSCSQHTIEVIRERSAVQVATQKEQTGAKLRRLVRMTLERLEECLEKDLISPGQLPVTAGILIDKSLAWEGQATATVTHRHEIDQDAVRRLFASLQPPAALVMEANFVDVEAAPDSKSGDWACNVLSHNVEHGAGVSDGVNSGAATTVPLTLPPLPTITTADSPTTTTITTAADPMPPAEGESAGRKAGGGGRDLTGGLHISMDAASENLNEKGALYERV